jgi:hypothetical protein
MEHYLAERYLAESSRGSLVRDTDRIRTAAQKLRQLRFVQTLYMPGDETCFFLFEGESAELVGRAADLAGIAVDRVVPVSIVGDVGTP